MSFGVGRCGPLDKNVENQACPVVDLDLQSPVEVTKLSGRQFVVEDDAIDLVLFDIGCHFGQFALSDEGFGRGVGHPLGEPFDGDDSGRLGQKLQLVEVFGHLSLLLLIADDGDQYGFILVFLHAVSVLRSRKRCSGIEGNTSPCLCTRRTHTMLQI